MLEGNKFCLVLCSNHKREHQSIFNTTFGLSTNVYEKGSSLLIKEVITLEVALNEFFRVLEVEVVEQIVKSVLREVRGMNLRKVPSLYLAHRS